MKRVSAPAILLFFAGGFLACGNQPVFYPEDDSSTPGSTASDDPSTDPATEPEPPDSTEETETGDPGTAPATDDPIQTESDSSGTAKDTATDSTSSDTSSWGTETVDTGSVDSDSFDTATDGTDTFDTGSLDTGSADTDTFDTGFSPETLCDIAALREPGLNCCPSDSGNGMCDDSSWWTEAGCCSPDLSAAVSCEKTPPTEDGCRLRCGMESPGATCVENSCAHPFIVDMRSGTKWTKEGKWRDYDNTFPGGDGCGDGSGGEDVWFAVYVPAGMEVVFSEAGPTDATVREVAGCEETACVAFAEDPEELILRAEDDEATFFDIVLSEASGFLNHPTWKVEVAPR